MAGVAEIGDSELIRLLLKGHHDAFTEIYRRCSGPIYRFALHMTGDGAAAEEVVQETFLFLFSNGSAYRAERGSLLAWLLGVARNFSRRRIGTGAEEDTLEELEERGLAGTSDPLGEFTRRELIENVRRAVACLPGALREVVILCELEGLEYREAAAVLHCPVGTVRSRLHRARGLLQSKLEARCMP